MLPVLFRQLTFLVQVRPDEVDPDDKQRCRQHQADYRQHGNSENGRSSTKNQKQDAYGQLGHFLRKAAVDIHGSPPGVDALAPKGKGWDKVVFGCRFLLKFLF
jgi:hypothetical protein